MDMCDIPGLYKAYIKLKGYKKRTNILGEIIFGKYKRVWTKWVEVSGGGGYEGNGVGYGSWKQAYEAIHEAAAAYSKPRPGHEVDVMTDEGLQEILGEENNDG